MALTGRLLHSVGRRVWPKSYEQVEAYAEAWVADNAEALSASDGRLWLVLGDSAAQGVGASAHDRGYVGQVRDWLCDRTGDQWRVLNLSRSGGRVRDVIDVQWPAALEAGVEPDLITALVGSNDARLTPIEQWAADVDELVELLPSGAVVGTAARGIGEKKAAVVNQHLRRRATDAGLLVADVWAHTGPPYRGLFSDPLHPNDEGYRQWRNALVETLETRF